MVLLRLYFLFILLILLNIMDLNAYEFDQIGQEKLSNPLTEKGLLQAIEKSNFFQVCGAGRSRVNNLLNLTRIVGGAEAGQHQYPWQVSLQVRAGNRPLSHLCGGSIIGKSWILTAAHCVKAYGIQNMIAIAGAHNLKRRERFHRQIRPIKKSYPHRGYNPLTQVNDVALVKTVSPFRFDLPGVAPACLPSPNEEFYGQCLITGWGRTKEDNKKYSDVLHRALVPLISDDECRRRFTKKGHHVTVYHTMMCAGHLSGGSDACQGDSGGPLVCPGDRSLPMLTGIVSWGIGCGNAGIPGVYTQVSKYVSWINNLVNTEPPYKKRVPISASSQTNNLDIKNSNILGDNQDSSQLSDQYDSSESSESLLFDSSEELESSEGVLFDSSEELESR